ncbi:hypothetical protein HMI55_006052 [Coelomomyces lativittatus]|nr:hypothetical protein HMI55_006052 [Coelomomyces lativittatus]
MKSIVLMLNERHQNSIVIEDLDENHLFVTNKPEILELIRKTVDKELEESRHPKSIMDTKRGFKK